MRWTTVVILAGLIVATLTTSQAQLPQIEWDTGGSGVTRPGAPTGEGSGLGAQMWPGPSHEPTDQRHHAVVSLIDTGVNPYHQTFRDPTFQASQYPATYIDGYPDDAIALNLTLDAEDYWAAVRADCQAVWSTIEPGQLYWFRGTKIIGAIFFTPVASATDCDQEEPVVWGILERSIHGTMTSSRAASFEYGACKECKLVMVQFPGFASIGASNEVAPENRWAAENAHWIDLQSNSWGPVAPVPLLDAVPQSYFGATPELARVVENVSRAHLAFWASGNGALFRFGVLGHPTQTAFHMTPSAIIVGGHDSGYITPWPGFTAHVVSDACASWAAEAETLNESARNVGSGTSAATPFAAGGAARILLEARRILDDPLTGVHNGTVANGTPPAGITGPLGDGVLTLAEWKDVVFKTGSARPEAHLEDGPACSLTSAPYHATPVLWRDIPEGFPEYIQIGYGAVDRTSMDLAFGVLGGDEAMPDRTATDTWFTVDHAIRQAVYDAYSGLP